MRTRSFAGAIATILLGALLPAPTLAREIVRITSCWDGDTCRAGAERIRIGCIDAPEVGQPGAAAATARTLELVVGRTVEIERITKDRYGRTVAELWGPSGNLGQTLVKEGLARIHPRYAHQCSWSR